MALKKILNGFVKGKKNQSNGTSKAIESDLITKGNTARDAKQWSKAASLYSEYLARHSESFSIWVQLGHAFKESGEFGRAANAYLHAMQLVKDDADLHLSFGHLYKVMGDPAAARLAYIQSFNIDKNTDAEKEIAAINLSEKDIKTSPPKRDTWSSKADIIGSNFDINFYLNQLSDHSIEPGDAARHYLEFGSFMMLNPSKFFSTKYYIDKNDDLNISAGEAFIHYLTIGALEGRLPCEMSNFQMQSDISVEEEIIESEFDESYYCSANNILSKNIVAIRHYINIGWKAGYNPNSSFDVNFYLSNYPDVRNYRFNPLVHYINIGRSEGRFPKWPDQVPLDFRDRLAEANSFTETLISPFFDAAYYRSRYVDISVNKLDPLKHFLEAGGLELRDPSAWFDTSFYCAQFPSVGMMRINPLVHYALIGKNLGVKTLPALKPVPSRIDNSVTNIRDADLRAISHRYDGTRYSVPTDMRHLHIHWIIPEFSAGGGGHMTIFRMVKWLEFFGHRCTLWVINPDAGKSQADREAIILKNYQILMAKVYVLRNFNEFGHCDCIIATSWDTAYATHSIDIKCHKFYFIQDYEPLFYPMGSRYLAARGTYDLDLGFICASSWLKDKMVSEHNAWARKFSLCADETYKSIERKLINSKKSARIAFYAREHTTRRAVELGMIALELLRLRNVDFIVDFFGTEQLYKVTPFEAHNWGIVDAQTLAEIYRNADIGVCFSSTNYSLVPQEMMACGLPVVELAGESTNNIFPEGVVTLAEPDPHLIANAIQNLIMHPELRHRQAQAASKWVDMFSWERSAREVEKAIFERILENDQSILNATPIPEKIMEKKKPKASVIIPTYNAGPLLREVIDSVLGQNTPWPFELIIIDSGSTDGTLELAESYHDRIIVIQISKDEFQHGRTRNLGVEKSDGQFIAFLTQDALPANDQWLYSLVTALERFPQAAGAFGRHFAWSHASAFTKRDMNAHFEGFLKRPIFFSKYNNIEMFNADDKIFKSSLHFYSDNNSCLAREVWSRIKYPEVDYGEDQIWASLVSSAGYGIVYVDSAAVYHSHDYDEVDTFKRARTEADFFRKWFGYELAPKDIQLSVGIANAADERWGISNGISQSVIDHQKRLNIHRMAGLAAGSFDGIEFKSPF